MATVGRPKMKEARRKTAISVSLSPRAYALAEKVENKSKFMENSILSMNALAILIDDLRSKKISVEEVLDEIADLNDVWLSEFDEAEDFVLSKKS